MSLNLVFSCPSLCCTTDAFFANSLQKEIISAGMLSLSLFLSLSLSLSFFSLPSRLPFDNYFYFRFVKNSAVSACRIFALFFGTSSLSSSPIQSSVLGAQLATTSELPH